MKKTGVLLLFLLLFIFSFSEKSNILVLHSYHTSYTWVDELNHGFLSVMKDNTDYNLYIEYMDTKRNSYERQYYTVLNYLKDKYKNTNIDLIVSFDDNALRFLFSQRDDLFGDVPVLFAGVNEASYYDFEKYPNFKGIVEDIDINSTVQSIKTIYPNTEKIYFIIDNKTNTNEILRYQILKTKANFPEIEYVFLEDLVINELLSEVSNLKENEQVYLLMYNKDRLGNFYSLESIAEMLSESSSRPIFTSWDFYFEYDVLGGMITEGAVHGQNVAKYALNILENPSFFDSMEQINLSEPSYVFNARVMKKFGISKKQLPENSKIINQEPSFYERYSWLVWTTLGVFIFILTYGIVVRLDLRKRNILLKQIQDQKKDLIASNEEMTAMNEELESQNEELEGLYKNIEEKNKELNDLIAIVSNIDKKYITDEDYYTKLINTAIQIIPEADYGSVSLGYDGKWKFVSTVGHDLEKLKAIPLKKKYMINSKNIVIIDIINENRTKLPPDIAESVREATKTIKESMIVTIYLDNDKRLNFALDIDSNSPAHFNKNSIEVFRAFTKLAENYIKNKLEIDKTRNAYVNFANKLAIISEAHDDATGKHIFRVGELAAFIAKKLNLDKEQVFNIKTFAPLHDIGKIFIPSEILNKPGNLNDAEWDLMKKHTIFGAKILDDPYFDIAKKIALYHHEKYDGSGYPYGLKGDKIPIEASIVALVDVYDALRSKRSYKPEMDHNAAFEIITKGDNKTNPEHFNPEVLKVFIENEYQIEKIFDFIV
jgi:HD-GYP domain-containing protein (c-di-GMP phosphodiesterase class II)